MKNFKEMKTAQINKNCQECSVVMLTSNTEELQHVQPWLHGNKLRSLPGNHKVSREEIDSRYCVPQHLYILSNDRIEDGDYYYNERLDQVFQAIRKSGYNTIDKEFKVIATTDFSCFNMVYDGLDEKCQKQYCKMLLPQIPQSFIEHFIREYNEGNVISKVLVEMEDDYSSIPENEEDIIFSWRAYVNSKIKVNQSNEISILTEQKQVFSREEVIDMLLTYKCDLLVELNRCRESGESFQKQFTDNWIQQNLK
jgi:hypothetical protein